MTLELRVLHVEGSQSDSALVIRQLERAGYRVRARRVDKPEAMRRALEEEPWDVVISDHQMGQFDAAAALLICQESGLDIPFLVVSGGIGGKTAVAMMKSGANDYLQKSDLARLAIAVQATQLGSFDYYPKSGKVVWSEALKAQFGLAADALVSADTFINAVHPEDRQKVQQVIRTAGPLGRYALECRIHYKGEERWLAVFGRVYFDDDGQPERYVGMARDVTESHRLDVQFRQLQKLESIGQLAGGIAHDFNNLLTVISGFAAMLLSDLPDDSPFRSAVTEISEAAGRAEPLTRRLLAFSRRQVAKAQPVPVNRLITDFAKMLRRLVGEEVELVVSAGQDVGTIFADPGQVEQVLMNLAVNARDAMPDGGRLSIETSRSLSGEEFSHAHLGIRPGPYVVISVTDTGTGMTDQVRAHLFEPFFTTKESGKGTGLGLSTVWGIMQQANGTVWAYSEPGGGSTFKLLFPAMETAGEKGVMAEPLQAPPGTGTVLPAEHAAGVRKRPSTLLRTVRDTLEAPSAAGRL